MGGVTGLRGGAPVTYRAAREVLLCAGSMGSPAILQRSGIGPAEHLRSLGIAEVHDSPQLGQGLREHHALVMQWKAKDVASANRQFFGLRLIGNVLRYYLTRNGPKSSATYEAGAWFRTRPEADRPDGQFLIAPYTFDFNATTPDVERHGGLQLCCYILRPESAGSVMIQSADPEQLPLVTPDFHSDPKDRQAMIDLVRYARKFVAQPAFEGLVFEETRPGPGYESDGEIIAAFDRMGPAPIMPPAVAAWAWTLIRWSISAFECGASKEREWSTPRCCRSSSPATPTARSRRSLSARRI